MTIRVNEPVSTNIDKRQKPVRCIEQPEKRWPSATLCAKEIGVSYSMLHGHLNNQYQTCNGLHYCYEEDFEKLREMQSAQVAKSSTENAKLRAENAKLRAKRDKERAKREELERKAALWDAYQKEQEAIRKAEEERQNRIAKLKDRIERRKRMVENIDVQYQAAIRRLMEAEKELAELEGEAK